MSEKQLNFLHIFDDEIQKAKTSAIENDADQDNLDDSLVFDEKEEEAKRKADELISKQERQEKEAELSSLRERILKNKGDIRVFNFIPFMEEIENYSRRMKGFQEEFELAAPGIERQKIYDKIIHPNFKDEEKYQESALLYLRYIEALNNERFQESRKREKFQKIKKKNKPKHKPSRRAPNPNAGKDAAAGEYLDRD